MSGFGAHPRRLPANSIDVLVLARYGPLGASSRVRFFQFEEALAHGCPPVRMTRQSLLDDDYLQRKYAHRPTLAAVLRGYGRRLLTLLRPRPEPVWWLEKELWPWVPAFLERFMLRDKTYALDLDDAMFHKYDQHPNPIVRQIYKRKIDALMSGAALVTAGNDYLAEHARAAGARRVVIVPTVVDLRKYRPRSSLRSERRPCVIVWIGSPATVHYLNVVAGALARLTTQRTIELRVIGARIELPGTSARCVPWVESTEADSIREADIGIMPLIDSPWERGKCGYKLVQYMACGLPVVASPVGVNEHIVQAGETGFLAADDTQWLDALTRLVDDPALRDRLGRAGRRRVEEEFSLQVTVPRLVALLGSLAARSG